MISSYVRQGQHTLQRWLLDQRLHRLAKGAAYTAAGVCFSAASLEQGMLPLVSGLVWACRGWGAVLAAAGGSAGYLLFWGSGGIQGVFWTGFALLGALLLGDRRISREQPLLIPALGMLVVSATGLGFQLFAGDTASIPLYLIRVFLGGAAPWLAERWRLKREPVMEWLCWGFFTLGLAQIAPLAWLGLGYVAAGITAVRMPFPCAAITGLALDMAGITQVPMTAVTVLSACIRFLPRQSGWIKPLMPACLGLGVMYACGRWDPLILPGLLLGGIAAGAFRGTAGTVYRKGETGLVQVRLEIASGILQQTRQLLQQVPERGVDTDALVQRAVSDACGGCSARGRCRDSRHICQLQGSILQKPLLTIEELPLRCKKGSRVLAQLRRAQEQMRAIQADRQRQEEYREAVVQQYTFLSTFLSGLSDQLSRSTVREAEKFTPVVSVFGNRNRSDNADRCLDFSGAQNQYYILLCDGMGTGMGAVQEGKTAAGMLRQMLSVGFPAEHALQSLNSICALRDRAGAVTADLVEICLCTGRTTIYKWGAAPSYLLGSNGVEKLGAASVPPGMAVGAYAAQRCSITLKKGQTLLLASDGLEETAVTEACKTLESPAMIAKMLLQQGSREDDATVVTIRLLPVSR